MLMVLSVSFLNKPFDEYNKYNTTNQKIYYNAKYS